MRYIFFVFLFILVSCSNGESGLCECVEAGDVVNKMSAGLLEETYSKEKKAKFEEAIEYRDSMCKPYREMGPAELAKAAEKCPQLKIEVDN
ncbi:MAG: hypothetical protein R3277_01995 [Brumimicrobium sp.]|nr:hypothetical protein [Brumimicrobium sp.]